MFERKGRRVSLLDFYAHSAFNGEIKQDDDILVMIKQESDDDHHH